MTEPNLSSTKLNLIPFRLAILKKWDEFRVCQSQLEKILQLYYLIRHTSFLLTEDCEWSVISAALASYLPWLLTEVEFYFRWLNRGVLVEGENNDRVWSLTLSMLITQATHSDFKQRKVSVSNPEGDFHNCLDSIETRKLLKTSLEQCWKIKLSAGEQLIMRVNPSMVRAAGSDLQKNQ